MHAAQAGKELVGPRGLERLGRRKLHEQRAEPISESGYLFKEDLEHHITRNERLIMRDRARDFYRESEVIGHARRPARIRSPAVLTIERRIDLDAGEHSRVPLQVAALGGKGILPRPREGPPCRSNPQQGASRVGPSWD